MTLHLGKAIREVDESLRAVASTMSDDWPTTYKLSREAFDRFSKSPAFPLRDAMGLMESWRLSTLNTLLNRIALISNNERADTALRRLLVTEELLIRLEGRPNLPVLSTQPQSPIASLISLAKEVIHPIEMRDTQERRQGNAIEVVLGTLLHVLAIPKFEDEDGVYARAILYVIAMADLMRLYLETRPELCAFALAFACLLYHYPPPSRGGEIIPILGRSGGLAVWRSGGLALFCLSGLV